MRLGGVQLQPQSRRRSALGQMGAVGLEAGKAESLAELRNTIIQSF